MKRNKLRLSFHFFNIKVTDKVMKVYYRQKELTRNKKLETMNMSRLKLLCSNRRFMLQIIIKLLYLKFFNPAESHRILKIIRKNFDQNKMN